MLTTIRGTLPLGVLGSVFAAMFFLAPAAVTHGEDVSYADSVIAPLRDAVYDHTEDRDGILALHREALDRISAEMADGPSRRRAEALAHYYLGRFYQDIKTVDEMVRYAADLREGHYLSLRKYYGERDEAMEAYEDAAVEAKLFLEEDPCAEAHRLYGEILGQMLIMGDVGDFLSIGKKAHRHIEDALEADPSLTKALIQEASRLAYSPSGYGGDPGKARELYRAALRTGRGDEEDLFNIYGGFGMAAFMEGKDEEAVSWFREASGIYPGNAFAAGMAEFLENGTEPAS